MKKKAIEIGFSYFTSKYYFLDRQLNHWFQAMQKWNGSYVILNADFNTVINEDVFIKAHDHGLTLIIHFTSNLPTAKKFNDAVFYLDLYKKWGAKITIFGDQPNTKQEGLPSVWRDETLVEKYLDRFIPLALHAMKIGVTPVLAPLLPGGDYWDTSFMDLALFGLKQRKMNSLLDSLALASYGFTYNRPLSWGEGGPERWPGSKPYSTPQGQQNQIGFQNYEWMQAISQRVLGNTLPVLILEAGNRGPKNYQEQDTKIEERLQKIVFACRSFPTTQAGEINDGPVFNESVLACNFSLETLQNLISDTQSVEILNQIFVENKATKLQARSDTENPKYFEHYLLLPSYGFGVSDVMLNKVMPLIKKLRPTVGFSFEEAMLAEKVTIFPDPYLFNDEIINKLKGAGCEIKILPQSGIEIATLLQE